MQSDRHPKLTNRLAKPEAVFSPLGTETKYRTDTKIANVKVTGAIMMVERIGLPAS